MWIECGLRLNISKNALYSRNILAGVLVFWWFVLVFMELVGWYFVSHLGYIDDIKGKASQRETKLGGEGTVAGDRRAIIMME